MSIILCMSFCIVLFAYFLSMLITAILLSRSCPIVDLKNVLMRRRALKDLSAEHEVARCRLAWDHALSLLSLYVSPLASSALEKKKREKKMPDRRLGIDMIFYKTATKTYFNPPDYTHMHSRTDINQHGRQLIRSSSPSAVLIITPSPSAELNVLTPSNNSHTVK